MERLDATKASLKKLGGGVGGEDNSEDADREVDVAESPTLVGSRNNKQPALISAPSEPPARLLHILTVTTMACHR